VNRQNEVFHGILSTGHVSEVISVLVFVLMLLLMGKGFTITRGKISTGGSIKIAIFMTLYAVTYAVLFFYQAMVSNLVCDSEVAYMNFFINTLVNFKGNLYEFDFHFHFHTSWLSSRNKTCAPRCRVDYVLNITYLFTVTIIFFQFFDPGLVLYIYASPPGYGILVLRCLAWIYFSYACFFTVKHYPEKSKFYYPFWTFYTIWYALLYMPTNRRTGLFDNRDFQLYTRIERLK
jgi:hypothetical protein